MLGLEELKFIYDRETDILEVFFGEPTAAYSDETHMPGVYVRYSFLDDSAVGATIFDYSRKDRGGVERLLPFEIKLPKPSDV